MATFLARKYRYADGVIYNPNRYDIFETSDGHPRRVGGALVLKGKAIAFIGHPGYGDSAAKIIKGARAYAWGADLSDALAKIRPALEELVA